VGTSMKACKADEERGTAARKAAKYADADERL
jgi:hypothetical protein